MDVIGVGIATLDFLLRVPSFKVVLKGCDLVDFDIQGGGMVATALVTLSKFGAKTGIITAVGDDHYGNSIISELRMYGVDTSHVKILRGHMSTIVFVLVDGRSGERRFLVLRKIKNLPMSEEDLKYISKCKILHVDTVFLDAALLSLQYARETGITTSLDVGRWTPSLERCFNKLLSNIDILIVSSDTAYRATRCRRPLEAANMLARKGPQVVVITLGSEGSICVTEGRVIKAPGFKVPVVDTTGAGDVYHGAFLYGILQGWDLEFTLRFSNAAAALKCKHLGGRRGIPDLNRVLSFLEKEGLT